jgi:AAA domain
VFSTRRTLRVIDVRAVSPENEVRVAERLKQMIVRAWPDVANSRDDRVDLLVGIRSPAEVDILVVVDLERPRELPSMLRRDGSRSPAARVQHALIAIEVKQLDANRFECVGNQIFARYGSESEQRSVAKQAIDAAHGIEGFAKQSGFRPFVHGIAWLTELDESALGDIEPIILGGEAGWLQMLDAAAQQNPVLYDLERPPTRDGVRAVRERLLNRRALSARDRVRVERLSRDLAGGQVVDGLLERAGSAQIRLLGRGGSGKTTSLALLAVRLAERGERVLILTFHKTLRSDIAHLVATLAQRAGVPEERILVETAMGFLISGLTALGGAPPLRPDGEVDYPALDAALDDARTYLVGDPDSETGDMARLRRDEPQRFAWDHVLVDEAQDWSNAERDFLRALYGHRRLVLADGIDQLVRRQTACDWIAGIPPVERANVPLGTSLRMLRNVALFANCTARALGFDTWRIAPRDDLLGGRIIVCVGEIPAGALLPAVVAAARANRADPVDCLICIPPSGKEEGRPRARLATAAESLGIPVWDGCDPALRGTAPESNAALRIVQYDSSRGLEGWITVALDVDEFWKNKEKHPN